VIAWLVLTALVVVSAVGASATAALVSRRLRPERARAVLDAGLDRRDLALLTGGPTRTVDAAVVELAARRLVVAADGRLTVTAEVDRLLDTPVGSAEYRPPFDPDEAMTLVSVRAAGADGLEAVRRRALRLPLRQRFAALAERGLVVTPSRRRWEPMAVAGPTLVALFVCWYGVLTSARLDETEWPSSIVVLSWLPVTLLTAFLWSRRPGYHGGDPRSALGRDVSAEAPRALAPDARQADRVAAGGFAAMTDDALRRAVRGNAAESRWRIRWRRDRTADANVALAAAIGLGIDTDANDSGDSGDSGDAGDSGGGGGD
jgi:uncharacterized protein (TIGR04222 family)